MRVRERKRKAKHESKSKWAKQQYDSPDLERDWSTKNDCVARALATKYGILCVFVEHSDGIESKMLAYRKSQLVFSSDYPSFLFFLWLSGDGAR